jgi:predicted dienelactone hydrolase
MGSIPHIRKHHFPSMPKDYIRRRRVVRRIGDTLAISLLSIFAAYFITRPTGGTGFSPPRTLAEPAPAASAEVAAVVPGLLTNANSTASSTAPPPAANFSHGYNVQDGPLTVDEVSDVVLHDAKRNKDLHVRVFYPNDRGKYPLIVFSHGAGGSQTCCESLTRHWASYGYVTVQPTHDDSALQRRNAGDENIRFMQAVRDALKQPALWESRPRDISFVLDSVGTLENRIPGLAGKIDQERIGVAGHSMGSYTTEAIAGALIDLPGHPGTNFVDKRVKAILCLSPQGPGQFGLTDHSFDRVALPYMGMTGSLDSLGPIASPAWHRVPFESSQPGDKYHLFIQGANHMSFISARTALPARASQGEEILGYTNSASLAFWDAYLKKDGQAIKYLESSALADSSDGAVKLSRR